MSRGQLLGRPDVLAATAASLAWICLAWAHLGRDLAAGPPLAGWPAIALAVGGPTIGLLLAATAVLALTLARPRQAGLVAGALAVIAGAPLLPLHGGPARIAGLAALAALGGLCWLAVTSGGLRWRLGGPLAATDRRRTRRVPAAGFAALAVAGVLVFGIDATAAPGLLPLHWLAAGLVGLILLGTARVLRPPAGTTDPAFDLAATAMTLYAIELIVGLGTAVLPSQPWVGAFHLALGTASFACLVAATAHLLSRSPGPAAARPSAALPRESRGRVGVGAAADGMGPILRAYIALTKPRIIELLLVTTVPAMVLATRDVPGVQPMPFVALVAWTLVGGTLAAGSANAINQYLDRDIDALMSRTRRRPLPGESVEPVHALVFGLALGAASFGLMLVTVNILAAFLTLLANAFYVVVYTLLLKRNTPQNIVIGGAAGSLPPVIGWAAVTGNVALPAVLLFLIVFAWTPPHFWALAQRLRDDYAAASVPMLPVVRGAAATNRGILQYTIVVVALTLALVPLAGMGLVYLAGAVGLGAVFIREAARLWREGGVVRAMRVYRISISYLAGLFAVVALDVLLPLRP